MSLANADYSNTSFMVSGVSVGANSIIGNAVTHPAGGRTGDNILLATKAIIPVDGPVREGVGLLGSRPFEIPRSVQHDVDLEQYSSPEELPARLARKNSRRTRRAARTRRSEAPAAESGATEFKGV